MWKSKGMNINYENSQKTKIYVKRSGLMDYQSDEKHSPGIYIYF